MTTVLDSSDVCERTWTKAEFYRLGELGFFHGQRVELIEGTLMVLSPQGPPHMAIITAVSQVLDSLFRPSHHVRVQGPIDLGVTTEPEPDLAIVVLLCEIGSGQRNPPV